MTDVIIRTECSHWLSVELSDPEDPSIIVKNRMKWKATKLFKWCLHVQGGEVCQQHSTNGLTDQMVDL